MLGQLMCQPLLISTLLCRGKRLPGSQQAVSRRVDGDIRSCTYAELASRSRRLARALAGLGVGLGARAVQIANGGRHSAEGDRQELTPA